MGISQQESTGAKAGRFVRAAGLALGTTARELNKNLQEARAADEARAAEEPRAVPVAAAPPPPANTRGAVGRVVFVGFVVAGIAFLLVVLRFESLLGDTGAHTAFQWIAAGILFAEAYLLLSNDDRANERLGQRLLTKTWGARGPVTRRERVFARVVRDGLTLVGIVFLAAGVFELLSATVGY